MVSHTGKIKAEGSDKEHPTTTYLPKSLRISLSFPSPTPKCYVTHAEGVNGSGLRVSQTEPLDTGRPPEYKPILSMSGSALVNCKSLSTCGTINGLINKNKKHSWRSWDFRKDGNWGSCYEASLKTHKIRHIQVWGRNCTIRHGRRESSEKSSNFWLQRATRWCYEEGKLRQNLQERKGSVLSWSA